MRQPTLQFEAGPAPSSRDLHARARAEAAAAAAATDDGDGKGLPPPPPKAIEKEAKEAKGRDAAAAAKELPCYPRPCGRAPLGKQWDSTTGCWVAAGEVGGKKTARGATAKRSLFDEATEAGAVAPSAVNTRGAGKIPFANNKKRRAA